MHCYESQHYNFSLYSVAGWADWIEDTVSIVSWSIEPKCKKHQLQLRVVRVRGLAVIRRLPMMLKLQLRTLKSKLLCVLLAAL